MSIIKNKKAQEAMIETGKRLSDVFERIKLKVQEGISTLELDKNIAILLNNMQLKSCAYGYKGFKGYSCISRNHEVIHGLPVEDSIISNGDLLKIDICASYGGYCADMARMVSIGRSDENEILIKNARRALDIGIEQAKVGNYVGDIGFSIENFLKDYDYDIIRDFCGHGIGKKMHEEPNVANYGKPKTGMKLCHGMAIAIEPMFFNKKTNQTISKDKWTVCGEVGTLGIHIEDTVIITDQGPCVITKTISYE
jgi:methionyl aminopeptidase